MAAMSVAAAMTVRQRRAAAQQARMPWEVQVKHKQNRNNHEKI